MFPFNVYFWHISNFVQAFPTTIGDKIWWLRYLGLTKTPLSLNKI
jgi:hypothetical protein